MLDLTGFKALFFNASDFYSKDFGTEKKELGRLYPQEYPNSPEETFLTTGDNYFDKEALKYYHTHTREAIKEE